MDRVFFLRHSQENSSEKMEGIEIISRLLACSFPPHWDPEGMESILAIFGDLATQTPCHEFGFKPDRSAINFIGRLWLS